MCANYSINYLVACADNNPNILNTFGSTGFHCMLKNKSFTIHQKLTFCLETATRFTR